MRAVVAAVRSFAGPAVCAVLLGGCAFGEPKPTTGVTLTGATLHGNIYSSFEGNTEYWWRYGGTPAYGSETPHRTIAIDDESAHPVAEPVTGLSPNTTYHFQLCARDGEESPPRTNCSSDATFSTASAIGPSRIAFSASQTAGLGIHTMTPTGGSRTAIPGGSGFELDPDWSPTAAKLVFEAFVGTTTVLTTMDRDGSDRMSITGLSGPFVTAPAWSPDGTKVAYETQSDVHVIGSGGGEPANLTDSPGFDGYPTWSPNGAKIAFVSDRDGREQIYVMDADGTDQVNVSQSAVRDSSPSWSPDGTRIVFHSAGADDNTDVWVMDANGANRKRLTTAAAYDGDPDWSPDNRKVAFTSTRDGDSEIWVMDADGSDQVNLTSNSESDALASWSAVP